MALVVDMSGANFEAMPKDVYPAVFSKYTINQGDAGPYAACEFTVSESSDFAGRKLFRNMSFSPQSLWATKRSMVAMGADPDELNGPVDVEEKLQRLIGNDCRLSVDIRMWEGEERNEVKNILAPDYSALAR